MYQNGMQRTIQGDVCGGKVVRDEVGAGNQRRFKVLLCVIHPENLALEDDIP